MVLAGYRIIDNRLKVWDKVDWIFSYFNYKHFHQKLPALHQFAEAEP